MKKNINKMILVVTLSTIMGLSSIGLPTHAKTVTKNTTNKTYSDSTSGGHAVYVSKGTVTLTNPTITKTGDASDEDADFYGTNAAVLAENDAKLSIKGGNISTNGKHANAVFSYGTATVNISNAKIKTEGDNSGGLMTTGGATMNASNLNIATSGNSSAAIRSDRGGGDVNVSEGTYKTTGTGSPVIYSTADIDVDNATLESSASEAVVIEGGNSVSLKDCKVIGDNTKLNGQAKNYDTIFIYQSMSGDASEGNSEFSSEGGTITSKNGDTFYVTNTTTTIDLTNTKITNADDGDFLVAEAAAWGNEGTNGGSVTLNASKENFSGDIKTDSISSVNLKLKDKSTYAGAINPGGEKGTVAVTIDDDSTWTLTGDSYIKSLSCDKDAIVLNGHNLYVDGELYKSGTASKATLTDKDMNTADQSEAESPDGRSKDAGKQNDNNSMEKDKGNRPDQNNELKGNGKPQGQPPEGRDGFTIAKVTKVDGNNVTVEIRKGEEEETKTYDLSSASITKGDGCPGRPGGSEKPEMNKDNPKQKSSSSKDASNQNSNNKENSKNSNKENPERPVPPEKPEGNNNQPPKDTEENSSSKDTQKNDNKQEQPPQMPPSDNKDTQQEEKATISDIKEGSMIELNISEDGKVTKVRISERDEKFEKEAPKDFGNNVSESSNNKKRKQSPKKKKSEK